MNPLVTIYITNHNYGKYLKQSIESVLSQSYKNFELLIIDDSLPTFKERILYLENKCTNIFLLVSKKNIKLLNNEKYRVFFKPLKIFELYEEIVKKISNNIKLKSKWKLDRSKLRFYRNNTTFIELTEKEFHFIYFLLKNKLNTSSKKELLNKVWKLNITNKSNMPNSRVLETMVSKVRKKLNRLSANDVPQLIKYKDGYKLLI